MRIWIKVGPVGDSACGEGCRSKPAARVADERLAVAAGQRDAREISTTGGNGRLAAGGVVHAIIQQHMQQPLRG